MGYISLSVDAVSKACSYFFDRGLLLTRNLLNQEFLVVKLMSTLQKFDGYHHDMVSHHKMMNQEFLVVKLIVNTSKV
jgi:hypothetical protein